MDQETAYKAMMAFAGQLRIKATMQKTIEGDWDVTIEPAGKAPIILHTRQAAASWFRQLRDQAKASA